MMDSSLKDCCGASDVIYSNLNPVVYGPRSGVPAGLKGRTHSRLDKGDADVDTTLHSWFDFPWMGESEYQGYLAFSSKSAERGRGTACTLLFRTHRHINNPPSQELEDTDALDSLKVRS